MNNITVLYYLLSGPKYYLAAKNPSKMFLLKEEVRKEIEYFFEKRHIIHEPWNKRYRRILKAVFCVNLLARCIERSMSHTHCILDDKYSLYAPATMLALREYNNNRTFFTFDMDFDVFLKDIVLEANRRVNKYWSMRRDSFTVENMVHSDTPMGVELEFTNKGPKAGKLFETGRDDALLNFSKYHYYHLMKFMWRLGAYVDAEIPFKQFIKRGGFLEYTFTRPDMVFKPSAPLTSSPQFAAAFVDEAIKFTPVHPHSLHITFQLDPSYQMLPVFTFDELLFLMITTGHFVQGENGVYESRITEGNMKDWAVIRDRRNEGGWVVTVEFTHMRGSRDFVRRQVYEPSMLLLLAYKNLFNFSNIQVYSHQLLAWAKAPYLPEVDAESVLSRVRKGLDKELSLPDSYKEDAVRRIAGLYSYNSKLLSA